MCASFDPPDRLVSFVRAILVLPLKPHTDKHPGPQVFLHRYAEEWPVGVCLDMYLGHSDELDADIRTYTVLETGMPCVDITTIPVVYILLKSMELVWG